jgi:citrate/tricarballylate utilization protein
VSFITLLFLTSLTGLLLLVLREQAVMGPLLILHLGVVLALFVTLPYGKFVHGLYRLAALIHYARDDHRTQIPESLTGHAPTR